MIRKRKLPLGILAVGLLLTLAVIGIVNGLWSKNLVINGSVETGDVQVDWVSNNEADEGCFAQINPLAPCDHPVKNVGKLDCSIYQPDRQILTVRAFNTYPSWDSDCEVRFQNTGSIPVNFIGVAILPGSNLTGCETVVVEVDVDVEIDCDQLDVLYEDGLTDQYDPGEGNAGSLLVHVNQEADQSDCSAETSPGGGGNPPTVFDIECDPDTLVNYEFQVKFCFAQWNEEASYADCANSLQHEGPGGAGGVGDPDYDSDVDPNDNCPVNFNPDQDDLDGDAQGDACDDDIDGDGTANAADTDDDNDTVLDIGDNCKDDPNPNQTDSDFNGIGNVCETNPTLD